MKIVYTSYRKCISIHNHSHHIKQVSMSMNCYIVTYDLEAGSSKDYDTLSDAFKSFGKWARITESTWAVVSNESAEKLRDRLTELMDEDGDRLFVVRSGIEAAWINTKCSNEWLKKNL